MRAASIDKELLDLEKQYWEAIRTRDSRAAARLSDDECVVVGPQGIGEIARKDLARMIESAPYTLERYSLDSKDLYIRSIRDDVAVVAYKVREEMVVDGEPTKLEAFDSSVWVRRDGKWVCALHTETIAGDPFGRDRRTWHQVRPGVGRGRGRIRR